jgi:hypothetical protein
MQLPRDAICRLIREEGLIPRFRSAPSKHRQGKRFSFRPIKHNLRHPGHITGIDKRVADFLRALSSALLGFHFESAVLATSLRVR